MRRIERVYIHCSGVEYGSFESIDQSHKMRRNNAGGTWSGAYDKDRDRQIYCGYHWVIENPYQTKEMFDNRFKNSKTKPNFLKDGWVSKGRPEDKVGAHVAGCNHDSIGICYIGLSITPIQLLSLQNLLQQVLEEYKLNIDNVFGHYEVYGKIGEEHKLGKTCPNINMYVFRTNFKHLMRS